jgi:hypothetical protein
MRDGADLGCGRAKGVSEGYVLSVGEQLLRRLGVPFLELIDCQLPLLEYLVKIVYLGHLENTSIVDASSFPPTPCDHPTLFIEPRGRSVLGS